MSLANKWMRKKIPSFCNLALTKYVVFFSFKKVFKIAQLFFLSFSHEGENLREQESLFSENLTTR